MNGDDAFKSEHLPNLVLVTQLITSWNATKAQTPSERAHSRAKRSVMGNRASKGAKQSRHIRRGFFNLRRRTTVAKNCPCAALSSGPKIPGRNPIVAGDMPGQLRRIGVARERVRRGRSMALTTASHRLLPMKSATVFVKTAVRGGTESCT